MTPTQRAHLARKLEACFQRQVELLAELAAAYTYEGRPVPPEVGEALGAVEHRRRAFKQIKEVLTGTSSGIGVKSLVERFQKDIVRHHETIQRLLELHRCPCAPSPP
jgi:hypothetical protein